MKNVKTKLRGMELLNHPELNKGTAFTAVERQQLHLEGLLPNRVSTIQDQCARMYENICSKATPLEQYIGLLALQNRNETLYYRLLLEHLEQFLPVVYTPTVGLACQKFSHIYRRNNGIWIFPAHRGRMVEVLRNIGNDDLRLIVVTDNERILGLGDQGVGGIGIPIGKLAIYSVAAGIPPNLTLPVSLDVGTDNQHLLNDPLYLGWRKPRLRGAEYDSLVDEFVQAVKICFPKALLQWEDFKQQNAFNLLDRYKTALPSFNDDIQGTAAIAVAGIMSACRLTGESLAQQKVMVLGAGAAGIGIGRQLLGHLRALGVSGEALQRAVMQCDSNGLLREGQSYPDASKHDFIWPTRLMQAMGIKAERAADLTYLIATYKPTVLIGTTGQAGLITQEMVEAMGQSVQRPTIMPFSNPNSNSEADPADLLRWSKGKALIATGSPYPPSFYQGKKVHFAQGNNAYIFPGVGLGAIVAEASVVTESMFGVAAQTVADMLTDEELQAGLLYPSLKKLRQVSLAIGEAVALEAVRAKVAPQAAPELLQAKLRDFVWYPDYSTYEAV